MLKQEPAGRAVLQLPARAGMAKCHPRESSHDLGVFSQGLGWFLGPAWGAGCAPLVPQHGKSHVAVWSPHLIMHFTQSEAGGKY